VPQLGLLGHAVVDEPGEVHGLPVVRRELVVPHVVQARLEDVSAVLLELHHGFMARASEPAFLASVGLAVPIGP
jgi:hypothetical protein